MVFKLHHDWLACYRPVRNVCAIGSTFQLNEKSNPLLFVCRWIVDGTFFHSRKRCIRCWTICLTYPLYRRPINKSKYKYNTAVSTAIKLNHPVCPLFLFSFTSSPFLYDIEKSCFLLEGERVWSGQSVSSPRPAMRYVEIRRPWPSIIVITHAVHERTKVFRPSI